MPKRLLIPLFFFVLLTACATPATPAPFTATAVAATATQVAATETHLPPTQTSAPSATPSQTASPQPSPTSTLEPTATSTETIGQMLKTHIVFYLIIPEKGRLDACGDIKVEPIISKRIRTGDKLQDVQIALNMLFNVGARRYDVYYNALWDTQFTIEAVDYNAKKDYMTITFGGYFPFTILSNCDKHGIREQIWNTFFHYEFREKTFKYYDKFLIDRLGGD
jgi:hypothetical protein